jgi:hypothetical protein
MLQTIFILFFIVSEHVGILRLIVSQLVCLMHVDLLCTCSHKKRCLHIRYTLNEIERMFEEVQEYAHNQLNSSITRPQQIGFLKQTSSPTSSPLSDLDRGRDDNEANLSKRVKHESDDQQDGNGDAGKGDFDIRTRHLHKREAQSMFW